MTWYAPTKQGTRVKFEIIRSEEMARAAMEEFQQYNEIPTAEELFEIVQAIGRASDSIRDAVDELEAMERESTND